MYKLRERQTKIRCPLFQYFNKFPPADPLAWKLTLVKHKKKNELITSIFWSWLKIHYTAGIRMCRDTWLHQLPLYSWENVGSTPAENTNWPFWIFASFYWVLYYTKNNTILFTNTIILPHWYQNKPLTNVFVYFVKYILSETMSRYHLPW